MQTINNKIAMVRIEMIKYLIEEYEGKIPPCFTSQEFLEDKK